MMKVHELGKELNALHSQIRNILSHSGALMYDPIDVTLNIDDPNEQLLAEEYTKVIRYLGDANSILTYLSKPISYEGTLSKNENGRYEMDYYNEFTSGSRIEFLYYDDFSERDKWALSRIEHSGDYYIVGYKEVELEGLKVRVRSS